MIYPGGLPLGASDTADATGTATLRFDQTPPDESWFVASLLLQTVPPRPSAVWQAFSAGSLSGFGSGAFARIAALPLLSGETLTVTVTGLVSGDSVIGSVPSGGGFRADDPLDVLAAMAGTASSSAFALASGSTVIASAPAPVFVVHTRINGAATAPLLLPALPGTVPGQALYIHHLLITPAGAGAPTGSASITTDAGTVLLFYAAHIDPNPLPLPAGGVLVTHLPFPPTSIAAALNGTNSAGDIYDYTVVGAII